MDGVFTVEKPMWNPPWFLFFHVSHCRFDSGIADFTAEKPLWNLFALKSFCNFARDGFYGGFCLHHFDQYCCQDSNMIGCWRNVDVKSTVIFLRSDTSHWFQAFNSCYGFRDRGGFSSKNWQCLFKKTIWLFRRQIRMLYCGESQPDLLNKW